METKREVGGSVETKGCSLRCREEAASVVAEGLGSRAELVFCVLTALLTVCVPVEICYFTSQRFSL